MPGHQDGRDRLATIFTQPSLGTLFGLVDLFDRVDLFPMIAPSVSKQVFKRRESLLGCTLFTKLNGSGFFIRMHLINVILQLQVSIVAKQTLLSGALGVNLDQMLDLSVPVDKVFTTHGAKGSIRTSRIDFSLVGNVFVVVMHLGVVPRHVAGSGGSVRA